MGYDVEAMEDAKADPPVEWPEGTLPDEAQTLSSRASLLILRRIASLSLAPGRAFTERELAEDLDLGKALVREALQGVTPTGLVSARSGSGYRVAPITLRQSRDLFEAWRVVEVEAVGLGATRGAAVETETLKAWTAVESYEATSFEGEAGKRAAELSLDATFMHVQFHMLAVSISRNGTLWAIANLHLSLHIERLLRFAHKLGATFDTTAADHVALVEAVQAGDPEAARRAAAEHIDHLETAVFDALLTSAAAQEVNLAEE